MQAGDAMCIAFGGVHCVQRDVGGVGIDVHKTLICTHDVYAPVNRPILLLS